MQFTLLTVACLAQFAIAQSNFDTVALTGKAMPAVVKITTDHYSGSGVILSPDGKIATALHVLSGASEGQATTAAGEVYRIGQVLSFDVDRDLAIIKIAAANLPVLELSETNEVTVGEPVLVIGSPLGLSASVTAGIVSAVRKEEGLIQTSAAINPGNSGGPIINARGKIIGIVDWKFTNAESLGFAVLVTYLRGMLASEMPPLSLPELKAKTPRDTGTEANTTPAGFPRFWKSVSGPEQFEVRLDGEYIYADRQILQNSEGTVFEKIESKKSGSMYVGSVHLGVYNQGRTICAFSSEAEFNLVTKTRIEGAMLLLAPNARVTLNPCYSDKPTQIVRFAWIPE